MKIGVLGAGRVGPRLAALALSGELPANVTIVGWAPASASQSPPDWTAPSGSVVFPDAPSLMSQVEGIVVDLASDPHWHQREVWTEAAAEAGKAVLLDAPLADFVQVYDRIQATRHRGDCRLYSVRPLRRTLAVTSGLKAIRDGSLGEILAIYASLHLPVPVPSGVADAPSNALEPSFEQSIADLLDPAVSALSSSLTHLHAAGNRSTAGGRTHMEAVHVIARTESGAVMTLDVAKAIPASLGSGGEAVLEITGRDGFLRLTPNAADLTLVGVSGTSRVAWREDPVTDAILAWVGGEVDNPVDAEVDRGVITALRMVKRSRATGKVVGPDGNPLSVVSSETLGVVPKD